MQYFYDGQVRRYLTQIVRAFSKFSYKDLEGKVTEVPVMYGDITKQVGSILRDNSENKIPSAPRMGVYITGLELDRSRLSDSSYISKINLREKQFDESTNSYVAQQAKGYTVERLHPTPFTLTVNVDLWTTSTDQKLQIMEQILMMFNPDLEFQTNDNYVDWTSLSVLYLEQINFTNRTIPVGTGDEIDVGTMSFIAPIYISPPTKVKRLGVITSIITSVFDKEAGTISLEGFNPPTDGTAQSNWGELADGSEATGSTLGATLGISGGNSSKNRIDLNNPLTLSYKNFDIMVDDTVATLILSRRLRAGDISWLNVMEAELPSVYQPGISRIELRRMDLPAPVYGTIIIDPSDQTKLNITFDTDTLPSNTLIETSSRSPLQYGTLDYIINPLNFNVVTTFGSSVNDIPTGTRILLLGILGGFAERIFTVTEKSNRIDTFVKADLVYSHKVYVNGLEVATTNATVDSEYVIYLDVMPNIGDSVRFELFLNEDGADAWKNADNSDFVSDANDIVEWDGSKWNKVFDADQTTANTYQTNLKTGEQYYWNGRYWVESVDGFYPKGTWRIAL
tara:strand:+ start:967 stop:2664 length:1698 start_codon:yes stop_codon:yes gene_type:complete